MHVIDGWSTKKGFDRTATPGSIAGLGEAASTARLRGALANLEYNENKLRAMEAAQQTPERVLPENLGALERWIQKPTKETEKERTLPETLGGMERWIQKPDDLEMTRQRQYVQRLQSKIPTLDYLSWGDRGMPRPETYTAENLTEYLPRIEQLAGYPGRPTKDMQNEAKEILKTASYMPEGLEIGASIWNFEPYKQARESGDKEAERRWKKMFYELFGQSSPRTYAVSQGFMNGTSILPIMETAGAVFHAEDFENTLRTYQEQGDQVSAQYPGWNFVGTAAGTALKYYILSKLTGGLIAAAGTPGPYTPLLQTGLTVSASRALQEIGDLATGRISFSEYLNHISDAEKQGIAAQLLGELLMMPDYEAASSSYGAGNNIPMLPGGTETVGESSLMPLPQSGIPIYHAAQAGMTGGAIAAGNEIATTGAAQFYDAALPGGTERPYDAFLWWKQQRDAAVSLAENPFKEIGTKSLIGMSKEEISRSLQERGIDQRFADRTAEMIALEGEVQKTLVPKAAAKQPETEKAKNRQELTEKEEEKAFLKGFNYDIIQEIQEGYSDKLKEELKSGRAWEESKEEFIQRAARRALEPMKGKALHSDLYEEEIEIFNGELSRKLTENLDRLLKQKKN